MKYPPSLAADVRSLAKAHLRATLRGMIKQERTVNPLENYRRQILNDSPADTLRQQQRRRLKATPAPSPPSAATSSINAKKEDVFEFEDLLKVYGEQDRNRSAPSPQTPSSSPSLPKTTPAAGLENGFACKLPQANVPVTFYQVTLNRSLIGLPGSTKLIAESLGLRRPGQSVIRRANPLTAGKIFHLKEVLHVRNLRLASLEEKDRYVDLWRKENRAERGFQQTASARPAL